MAIRTQFSDALLEHALHQRIEAARRLVKQKELDVARERRNERNFLPIPFRVITPLLREVELESLGEVVSAATIVSTFRASFSTTHATEQAYGLTTRERRPETHVARNVGESFVQLHRIAPWITPEQSHPSRTRSKEPEQYSESGRLPRSVRSEKGMDIARLHVHVESVERYCTAEPLRESRNLYDTFHSRRPFLHESEETEFAPRTLPFMLTL